MKSLVELFRFYGTDKDAPNAHSYAATYESLLGSRRDSVRSVLELGVLSGASLRAWHAYFSNAEVVGLDISPPENLPDEPGIWVLECDVTDADQLNKALSTFGPFDFGADDASHRFDDQLKSFELLWPRIRPGGLWVIEDVQSTGDLEKFRKMGAVVYDLRHERKHDRNWDNMLVVFHKPGNPEGD